LFATLQAAYFREDFIHQVAGVEEVEALEAIWREEDFNQLLADALGAYFMDAAGTLADGRPGGGFDREIQGGGKAYAAEDAELVFVEALGGNADGRG